MKLTCRTYQTEEDYWRIRSFLRQVYLLNGRRESSWQVYRFDYWRWHGVMNIHPFDLNQVVFIWETGAGEIAAVLNPEGPGEAHLQVHPDYRAPELEAEMISTAEQHLPLNLEDGRKELSVWAHRHDTLRREILLQKGYSVKDWPEHQRCRPLTPGIPRVQAAEGYSIRSLGEQSELPARSWASWRAFHPNEPDDRYEGWEWYPNVQRSPLYRRDLDIVAVAPGGEIAGFCTVWFDDYSRTAAFEPVGVVPEHQQRGIGKAIMSEALCRAQHLGATLATVSSYSAAAHALYASAGFTEFELYERWEKVYS